MKFLRALGGALSMVERTLLVLILGSMIILAFLQVILRNYFSTGFYWADPLLRHMVLWIGFIGASLATQQEKHISLDLVSRFASPRQTQAVRIVTSLFAAVVCVFLANAGWTFLASERESAEILLTIGTTEMPAWWFQSIIPVGFSLIAFRFFLKVIEHIVLTVHPPPATEPPLSPRPGAIAD